MDRELICTFSLLSIPGILLLVFTAISSKDFESCNGCRPDVVLAVIVLLAYGIVADIGYSIGIDEQYHYRVLREFLILWKFIGLHFSAFALLYQLIIIGSSCPKGSVRTAVLVLFWIVEGLILAYIVFILIILFLAKRHITFPWEKIGSYYKDKKILANCNRIEAQALELYPSLKGLDLLCESYIPTYSSMASVHQNQIIPILGRYFYHYLTFRIFQVDSSKTKEVFSARLQAGGLTAQGDVGFGFKCNHCEEDILTTDLLLLDMSDLDIYHCYCHVKYVNGLNGINLKEDIVAIHNIVTLNKHSSKEEFLLHMIKEIKFKRAELRAEEIRKEENKKKITFGNEDKAKTKSLEDLEKINEEDRINRPWRRVRGRSAKPDMDLRNTSMERLAGTTPQGAREI